MKKIIILSGGGESTNYLYNHIKKNFIIDSIIIEGSEKKLIFLKRRVKRLGYLKVIGQILFLVFIPRFLNFLSKKRIKEIKRKYDLKEDLIPENTVFRVPSINSSKCIDKLKKVNPDLIIVNGTRIIHKKVLNSVKAIFINTHTGITPKYRGVHGGYWALANNDKENCGVTVHMVDTGIDTGKILFQKVIEVSNKDNYSTYPYIQFGEGIQLMEKAIINFNNDNLISKGSQVKESKLWWHPTIWEYVYYYITKGIK